MTATTTVTTAITELRVAALRHVIACYSGPDDDTLPVLRHWLVEITQAAGLTDACYVCGTWAGVLTHCNVDGLTYCERHYPENLR